MTRQLTRRFIMRAIETMCSIGIHDFEKQAPQRILVDVEILLDPTSEPRADNIADALNYDHIRDAVVEIAASKHFELQETLARQIFDRLSSMHSVVGLSVQTSKPDVYKDVGCASYKLSNLAEK
jgi:dihydroneopterin aldolase